MKTILVPIDFSDVTNRVLEKAVELARALTGRLVILHVIQPPVNLSASDPILIENTARITVAAEKAADKHLDRLRKTLLADFDAVEVLRVTGAPVAQILEQASGLPADYIVLGSHGHTAVYDLLVGSTAHGVLKKSSCPVIIVPPSTEQRAA
ncbi:MAG: universal stress protein [Opitutaceae bacterium]|jgi:nucleotide-binding universal stress UspA family protein